MLRFPKTMVVGEIMMRSAAASTLLVISLVAAMPAYGQTGKPRCAYYPHFEKALRAHAQAMREFQRTRQCSLIPRVLHTMRQLSYHLERGYRICGNIHFPSEIGKQAAVEVNARLRAVCR